MGQNPTPVDIVVFCFVTPWKIYILNPPKQRFGSDDFPDFKFWFKHFRNLHISYLPSQSWSGRKRMMTTARLLSGDQKKGLNGWLVCVSAGLFLTAVVVVVAGPLSPVACTIKEFPMIHCHRPTSVNVFRLSPITHPMSSMSQP